METPWRWPLRQQGNEKEEGFPLVWEKGELSMVWDTEISFDGFQKRKDDWQREHGCQLCDLPIDAQFALDLIFKTLVDDKENYAYLTTVPETREQINGIMLDLILKKYSRDYRNYLKRMKQTE